MLFSWSIHTVFHFVPNVFTLPSRTFHGLCLLSPALTEARFPENTTSLQASRAPAQLSYRRFGGKADILLVTDSLFTPEDKPAFLRDSGHLAISPSSPPSHCPLASQLLPLLTEDFSTWLRLHPQVLSSSWSCQCPGPTGLPTSSLALSNPFSPLQPERYKKNTNLSFLLLPTLQWLPNTLRLKPNLPNAGYHNLQDRAPAHLGRLTSFPS